jgi:3-oxoacyl-[acyl-carrier protein] reductase
LQKNYSGENPEAVMRTLFITGGSRGIGAATAEKFKNNGYNVIMPTREEMDLTSPESVKAYFENKRSLKVDCIVNNAGINPLAAVDEIADTDIFKTININLAAPLMVVRALIGEMKKSKYGRIVNIGSIWGIVSKEKRVIYSMTKNGIHGLTNTLAVEFGKYNILANTVCPGYTNTDLTRKNVSAAETEKIEKEIPVGRFAETDEIAGLIYFLGSDRNTYITGQRIAIDGGFTAR